MIRSLSQKGQTRDMWIAQSGAARTNSLVARGMCVDVTFHFQQESNIRNARSDADPSLAAREAQLVGVETGLNQPTLDR
jgi:hypothetical protein